MKITPKKSLGQNFLVNKGVVQKILNATEITDSELVVEIGPGKGILTGELGRKANRVIAIEKDHRLISDLKNTFREFGNIEIIEDDVLKFDPYSIIHIPYKIVSNIPYYITSNLLRKIFEEWPRPELIVLTVQKEVAQRIIAKPPRMNLLALSVQFYAEPKIISYVSRGSFRPIPKVDSALLRIKLRMAQQSKEVTDKFFKLIKTAFAGKRKQLVGNLSKNFGILRGDLLETLGEIGIRDDVRAENLTLEQWLKLSNYLKKYLN